MPGPAPNPNAIRRNARVGPVRLPAEGRKGPTPRWPLPEPPSASERKVWKDLWTTPQAVMWEAQNSTRTVARYCRMLTEAEAPGARPSLLGQVTAVEDRLGLTPKAMRTLMWEIVSEDTTATSAAPAGVTNISDIKKRLRPVDRAVG